MSGVVIIHTDQDWLAIFAAYPCTDCAGLLVP